MTQGQQRVAGIDVLRGIAIFFVLMNHVNIRLLINKVSYAEDIPRQIIGALVWNGQNGVQIFFAVSGFLIASMTLRRWGAFANVKARDFYLLRFARIAPLLLVILALLSILHLAAAPGYVILASRSSLGRALFAALTFHINLLETNKGYLPPGWDILWSLSVEEVFYLGFPIACIIFGRGKLFTALLCAFVIAGPFARVYAGSEIWREYSYLGSMDAIALGCLTALFLNGRTLTRRVQLVLRATGVALMLFILCFEMLVRYLGIEDAGLDMTILAFGACMVIGAAGQGNTAGSGATAPLRWLGRRSYEVYLTHIFIVLILLNIFIAAGKPLRAVPAYFIATVILAGFLGELTARFFSEPMNRMLRNRFSSAHGKSAKVLEAVK